MVNARDMLLERIAYFWFYQGYGEPYPQFVFLSQDGVSDEGYFIFDTRCRMDKVGARFLPDYLVFRIQQDPVFGWYFKEVQL